jgi:hypothetical protein
MNIPIRIHALLLAGSLAVGCGSSLSTSNVDKINEGMTREQVEAILGKPDTVDTNGTLRTCSWKSGGRVVVVYYSPDWVVTGKAAE